MVVNEHGRSRCVGDVVRRTRYRRRNELGLRIDGTNWG